MKRVDIASLFLFFYLVAGLFSPVFAAGPGPGHDWRAALTAGQGKENLIQAIVFAHEACVPIKEVISAAIKAGYEPYLVVKTSIDPECCPGACVCEAITGALDAGVPAPVVLKAALDAGADQALVERGLASRGGKGDEGWRSAIERATTETELGQALANAVLSCVPVGEVVKTALNAGHEVYPVVSTVAKAAGPGCICSVAEGALAAGVPPGAVFKAAALDPCACLDTPLAYTEEGNPPEPPPPPPPPISPAAPK